MTEKAQEPKLARSFSLDLPKITSIEFPGNVINVSRAVDMLGSQATLKKTCASKGDKHLELRFRPDDPYEHPIISSSSKVQNITVKVTLPKKYLDEAQGDLQKAIKLSKDQVEFKPEYVAETNYRFRELCDFQYNTKNSKFLQKIKKHILSGDYDQIKDFDFDYQEKFDKFEDLDIPPPPRFSPISYPFNYRYRQNPSLVAIDDGKGGYKLINRNKPAILYAQYILWNSEPPKEHAKELQELTDPKAIECRKLMEKLFEERPIWTRRSIEYHLPKEYRPYLKHVIHYVSYVLHSGPWRNAVVKYGIDTRSNPDYRIYQTRRFRYNFKSSDAAADPPYVFDGVNMIDGSIVQFCDITDPDIRQVIDNATVRETVDKEAGWFEDLDYHKIKLLLYMKYKAVSEHTIVDKAQIQSIVNGLPSILQGFGTKITLDPKPSDNEAGQSGVKDLSSSESGESDDGESDDNNENVQGEELAQVIPLSKDNVDALKDLSGIVRWNESKET